MKRKHIIAFVAALMVAMPAFAVFNEKDISHTISVLRFELKQQYDKMNSSDSRFQGRNRNQRRQMVEMMKKCNELSIILYSQGQDYTFDVTYALGEVTDQYESFNRRRMPYDDIVAGLSLEIDRYERLLESLRRLPPSLEEIDEVPDSLVKSLGGSMFMRNRSPRGQFGNGPRPGMGPGTPGAPGAPLQLDSARRAQLEAERRAFVLDEQGQEDRDSCIFYALSMLRMYKAQKAQVTQDSENYTEMSGRLKGSYDYAQNKYKLIQKRIFIDGQDSYFKVLGQFRQYVKMAWQDAQNKYSSTGKGVIMSEWRGPVVSGFILFVLLFLSIATVVSNVVIALLSRNVQRFRTQEFKERKFCITLLSGTILFALCVMVATKFIHHNFIIEASSLLMLYTWLLIAILFSLLVRLKPEQLRPSLAVYAPVLVLGLIVVTFRIIFIPNRVVNLIYPPLLLLFAIWQLRVNAKNKKIIKRSDSAYAWITFIVILVAVVMSWVGYVLMAVQVFIWWLFQLTAIATITAAYDLLGIYDEKVMEKRIKAYDEENNVIGKRSEGAYIEMTWAFDLIEKALLPVCAIVSVLACIWLAAGVFDLTAVCRTIFFKPFFNLFDTAGNTILHLSLFKLVLVSALYFVFKYLNYVVKAVYRHNRLLIAMQNSGKSHVHANEVNLTLANNLIGIILWGTYVITAIVLLKIPMGAISVVAAGLATGIGLALKDVLNNFIYGIQLMSGRLRVGDFIECDGVRGKVDSISYQTTQICTPDGAVMSFTNSTLFSKNFKNLTRNNAYELVVIPVGVAYGSNVNEVRKYLLEALQKLDRKDAYGRDVLDQNRGISVAFSDFGESSVDLIVKQFVLVEERLAYMAEARELIYNTLNEHNIEIPFPQRDVNIKKAN